MVALLELMAAAAEAAGDLAAAVALTRRQVALDPLSEEAHRELIGRLAAKWGPLGGADDIPPPR